ncbi:MAG: hypothetical protein LKF31_11115 [Muribaculaceae bacterium]|jgi:hypothetical protein|nr:hypothetical protein [Muribaculaceae bacterium]
MIPEVFISAIKIMKKDRIRCYNGIKYNAVIPNLCNFAAKIEMEIKDGEGR